MRLEIIPVEPIEDLALLRRELLDLDVERVDDLVAGTAPEGTRGLAEIGGLVVMFAESPLLGAVLGMVQDWLARRRSGSVVIQFGDDRLELTGVSSRIQREALEAFLARHQA